MFPKGRGDLFEAEVRAARDLHVRFHPCRGSMDRGRSYGGLPPDEIVEDRDEILAATEAAIDAYHDPSFSSMLRVAVAPCSPFSVSEELMTGAAALARRKGVRLHTHLAETLDEEEHCREQFGCTPGEYMEKLGWLGSDVWFAHCVHLHDDDIRRFAATGTGTAHCPSSNGRLGAGIARVADLLAAGAPVGLGVDGAASSELTSLAGELRQALLFQRAVRGPRALTARQALELGTLGGARCLGRQDEIGTLEPGKLADLAVWRVDGYRAAVADPVCALVFGPVPPLDLLLVGGRTVVERGELRTGVSDPARAGVRARARLIGDVVTGGHVVIAPDKFKGSLGAPEAAARIAAGLRRVRAGVPLRRASRRRRRRGHRGRRGGRRLLPRTRARDRADRRAADGLLRRARRGGRGRAGRGVRPAGTARRAASSR